MGFGGEVTLLGCKVGVLDRLPASFFVSVAYNCWAYRRLGMLIDAGTGDILDWQYRVPAKEAQPMSTGETAGTGRQFTLEAPISEAQIRELRVGDVVTIKGMMITVEGQVQTDIKGLLTNVTADAMLKMAGGITMIG